MWRGTNENTNGLLRQYFPKGTDLSANETELAAVALALNTRPRRWTEPCGRHLHLALRRPVESGQYLSIRYTERLAEAGIEPSVCSRGDSYDNALAETVIGLFKTDVIRLDGPWRGLEDVEIATLEWVWWYNERRLLELTCSP